MPIDDRTTNRSYQLPNAANLLSDDVARLRAALNAIDADVFARYTKTEVDQLITNLINGAPGALNTLDELAAALGDDANYAATVTTALSNRYTKTESDARYAALNFTQSGTGAVPRTVQSKLLDVVSVKDFGAVGDGTTDDTAAIQAALNTTSKAIYFPDGLYRVARAGTTAALTSTVADRQIFGEGRITATSVVRKVFYITGARTQFRLDCAGNNLIGVFVHTFADDCEVTRCRITNLYSPASTGEVNGVRVTLDGLTGGAVVSDNFFNNLQSVGDTTGANGVGMARAVIVEASSDVSAPVVISNNTIRNVIGEEGDAINVINSSGGSPNIFYYVNLIIQNNTIVDFNRRGIKIQCFGARIIGNTLRNTWTSNQGNMQGVIDLVQGGDHYVVGNVLDNCKYITQIRANEAEEGTAGVSNITISNNVITRVGVETTVGNLIYVRTGTQTNRGSGVTISNNVITCPDYAGTAITVANTDKVFVDNNRVDIAAAGTKYNLSSFVTNLFGESLVQFDTQKTATGTNRAFLNIPYWAKRVTVSLWYVSTNGTSNILVQLGTGGTPTTSLYAGYSVFSWASGVVPVNSTAGIPIFSNANTYSHFGQLTFTNVSGNAWVASGQFVTGGTQGSIVSGGIIELAGVLDYLRIVTANGTDQFDAGAFNVSWE